MKTALLVIGVFIASSAFGQQSTTNTDCNVNGQQINCTSNTIGTGSTDAQRAEQQREMNEAGKAIGSAVGSLISNKVLKHRVNKWCEGHPEGSWNFGNGQSVSCFNWNEAYQPAANTQLKVQYADRVTTITVAAHVFCKAHPDQSWTGPISGKVTPCGQVIALQDVECSRNPDSVHCKAIAAAAVPAPTAAATPATPATPPTPVVSSPATVPTPSAVPAPASATSVTVLTKEQKDEVAYCQRNPGATITRTDGTLIPCTTVLENSR
jgi:hypothetical protein